MDSKTAISALEYVITVASRRQLRTVARIAVKCLTLHLQPDDLAQAVSEISGALIDRKEEDNEALYHVI